MRAREFITEKSDQKLDEFLPALAAAAAPVAGMIGRGALAAGQAIGRGALAAGDAALTGAQAVGRGVVQGAQKVGSAVAQGVEKVGQAAPQAAAKVTNNIKTGVDNIKSAVQQAGGGNVDSNRLSKTLATQVPGQPMNPQAQKDLQTLMPGLADALMNPSTASQIKQAISTGAKKQAQLQQQQQTQQQQTQQQQQKASGPAGSPITPASSYQIPQNIIDQHKALLGTKPISRSIPTIGARDPSMLSAQQQAVPPRQTKLDTAATGKLWDQQKQQQQQQQSTTGSTPNTISSA
jgi:hypothetical protein